MVWCVSYSSLETVGWSLHKCGGEGLKTELAVYFNREFINLRDRAICVPEVVRHQNYRLWHKKLRWNLQAVVGKNSIFKLLMVKTLWMRFLSFAEVQGVLSKSNFKGMVI